MGRTLAFFLESEFTLLVVVLVLSATTILTTLFEVPLALGWIVQRGAVATEPERAYLSLILRHID